MIIRVLYIAFWAFWIGRDITGDLAWKPFWIVIDSLMLIGSIVWAVRHHDREIEKARSVRLWRAR